jgi:two-component system cell cycle sensor histidine kinase/response regulator CckA
MEVAAQRRPDLVVLDVGLPDMPGTELFGRLRRLHENLPIVFSTGHAEREVKTLTAGQSNVTCLLKPYGYEALSQAVRDVGVAA